jgi:hypothetical protein
MWTMGLVWFKPRAGNKHRPRAAGNPRSGFRVAQGAQPRGAIA